MTDREKIEEIAGDIDPLISSQIKLIKCEYSLNSNYKYIAELNLSLVKDVRKQAAKQTAKAILQWLWDKIDTGIDSNTNLILKQAKKYGVEIGE